MMLIEIGKKLFEGAPGVVDSDLTFFLGCLDDARPFQLPCRFGLSGLSRAWQSTQENGEQRGSAEQEAHEISFSMRSRAALPMRACTFINRSGHFSYREHPAEFNEMLRSFIGRNI